MKIRNMQGKQPKTLSTEASAITKGPSVSGDFNATRGQRSPVPRQRDSKGTSSPKSSGIKSTQTP